jgi:hypothetical protein
VNRGRALTQLTACIRGRAPDDDDWPEIVALANDALVTGQLAALFKASPQVWDRAPEQVRSFLEEVRTRALARNASLFGTLKDALSALNEAGIEPTLMKGCALWALEQDLDAAPSSARVTADLDLLTRGEEFGAAVEALGRAGFAVLRDNRAVEYHPVVLMGRPCDSGSIDLHQFVPGPRGIAEIDGLADRANAVAIGGARARAPSIEMQILVGALHDAFLDGHFWRGGFELRRLLDIRALTCRPAAVDWQGLLRICKPGTVRAAVVAQLIAAKEIAGAAVPESICEDLWARLHYWRQRLQFVWPALNAPFHWLGLNRNAWLALLSRGARLAALAKIGG